MWHSKVRMTRSYVQLQCLPRQRVPAVTKPGWAHILRQMRTVFTIVVPEPSSSKDHGGDEVSQSLNGTRISPNLLPMTPPSCCSRSSEPLEQKAAVVSQEASFPGIWSTEHPSLRTSRLCCFKAMPENVISDIPAYFSDHNNAGLNLLTVNSCVCSPGSFSPRQTPEQHQ